MKPRILVAFFALPLGGCTTSPGGPDYPELGIRSLQGPTELVDECVPLPVLPGGVVTRDIALAPGLTSHVRATRDSATVILEGVDDPHTGRHTFEPLDGFAEIVEVTVAGQPFSVAFRSPCAMSVTSP